VQLQRVKEFAASTPASLRSSLEAYSRYLERRRSAHRKEMLAALSSPRYFALLERLEKFATGAIPAADAVALRPVGGMSADAIARAYRRVRKRGRKVRAEPRPEDLHALRIRAKRLRYVLEFCEDLTGREGRRAVGRLVRLQDLLGAFHDAMVAADFVREYVDGPGKRAGAAALITMGAFLAQALRRADDMRGDFARTWKRFERRRTRREFDAIIRALQRGDAPVIAASEPQPETSSPPIVVPATSDSSAPIESANGDLSDTGPDDRRPPAKSGALLASAEPTRSRTAGGEEP
jgi:CHAD domain-containing protein